MLIYTCSCVHNIIILLTDTKLVTVLLEYIHNGDCSIKVYQCFSLTCNLIGKDFQYILKIIIPIILALCLMLLGAYYAKHYAGIIGQGLYIKTFNLIWI